MRIHDAAGTARLLAYPGLVAALEEVLEEYRRGEIASPERQVVPCGEGRLVLSMPCAGKDVLVHKLLTLFGDNPARGLPMIQGAVTCLDAADGRPLFVLDAPTVTARRTAAVTLVGLRRLRRGPLRSVRLIGTGMQARAHAEALLEWFPEVAIAVQGRSAAAAASFCAAIPGHGGRLRPASSAPEEAAQVVVALTSSLTPVYDEPARPERLVVGTGAYRLDMREIGPRTIQGSQVYVDDPVGAPVEAGDVAAAGTDWRRVKPLALALTEPPDPSRPVFLKSVGCAAWDLAACRAAGRALAGGA